MAKQQSLFDAFNAKVRGGTRGEDPHLHLWQKWDDSGRKKEHLEPLMDALEPTIQAHAKRAHSGLGGSIPYSAVEAKFRSSAKKSLDNYEPGRSKVRTWVIGGFRRTNDFILANRNFAAVPKDRLLQFQRFQNAKNEFMTERGHEPTLQDLKVLLPDMKESDLKAMQSEFRRELFIGGSPNAESDDSSLGHTPSEIQTIFSLMPTLLSPEEKRVFEELKLSNPTGAQRVNIEAIAKKLKMTPNQVYRLRASIYDKAKPHLDKV